MTNERDSDLIEVPDDIAAIIAGNDPDATALAPTETAPAPTETAPTYEAPATPDVPEWFQDVDPAARAAVVQRAIESLTPEERNNLPIVQETARTVQQTTQQQVQHQSQAEQQAAIRDAELQQAASEVKDSLKVNLHPDSELDIDHLIDGIVVPAAQAAYHDMMAANIEEGLKAVMNYLGIQEIPAAAIQAIDACTDYAGVIAVYCKMMAEKGFDLGVIAQKGNADKTSAADKAALTARYKSWGIAQAAKDGRLRISRDDEGLYAELLNSAPPALGSGAVMAGGDELSQEEFDRAVENADYMEQLLSNPSKKAAWDRAIAEALQPATGG